MTDQDGQKITDEGTLNYIEKVRVVLILATLKTSCVFYQSMWTCHVVFSHSALIPASRRLEEHQST